MEGDRQGAEGPAVTTTASPRGEYRREPFRTPEGGTIDAAIEGNAIVPVAKVTAYARGRSPFPDEMRSELRELRRQKQTARRAFDADPTNEARLKKLERMKHNHDRSTDMAETLEEAGLEDTPTTNEDLIRHLLQSGQDVTQASRVDHRSEYHAPGGTLKILTTWTILPDGRAYLSTLKVIPIR